MVVTSSGDALHLLRLILDTPLHEGVKRDGAEVQGGGEGRAALRKTAVSITIIPLARGLATSPGRRARLRFSTAQFYV